MPPTRPVPPEPPTTAAPVSIQRPRRAHPLQLLVVLIALVLTILVGGLAVVVRVTGNVVADRLHGDATASVPVAEPPAPPAPMRSDIDRDAALAQLRGVADQAIAAAGEGDWGDDPAIAVQTLECGAGGTQFLAVDTFTGDPLAAARIEQAWAQAGVGAAGSVIVGATATPDASGVRVLIASDCVAPPP
ncbi:hypothetical protein HQQ81_02470 [Microbacteriaceae bacterium VKM Ac-2854]|nr:hypothetical protein [Microbacteriaceae bacterium VKM Ac-2854]